MRPSCKKSAKLLEKRRCEPPLSYLLSYKGGRGKVGESEGWKSMIEQNNAENMYPWLRLFTFIIIITRSGATLSLAMVWKIIKSGSRKLNTREKGRKFFLKHEDVNPWTKYIPLSTDLENRKRWQELPSYCNRYFIIKSSLE